MPPLAPASLAPAGLAAFLHEHIPLTRAMGLTVIECSPARLVLEAPLAPNRNHLGTAFGGSLHALPTLACYGALWLLLREGGREGHVVVKRSQAAYRAPVTGPLRALCLRPAPAAATEFLATFQRHGKARLDLAATVEGTNGRPAVEFSGTFVAVA